MAVCVCLCMSEYVCVWVSRGWIERHSVKKIFQKHFASVTLTRAVDWHALLDRNQSYQPICHALRMAWSSGRGLSGKWCCSRHSLSTVYVCICKCVSAEDGKVFNQRFDWKTHVSLKIRILYTDVLIYIRCMCVCPGIQFAALHFRGKKLRLNC